jgi:DNA-binding HxlR family transcriptional regulator
VAGPDPCPFAPAVELLFGRWTSHVLWTLEHHGRMRFSDLRTHIPDVTPKVLTDRLRKLERDGLLVRTYHREMPPRVEYESTELARTLMPAFQMLAQWTEHHMEAVHEARHRFDTGAGEPTFQAQNRPVTRFDSTFSGTLPFAATSRTPT